MKRISINTLVLLAIIVTCGVTLVVRVAFAQTPKVTKVDGHLSPLYAKVTFPDDTTRQYLVLGRGDLNSIDNTHQFKGKSDAGEIAIWMDTIKVIKDTDEQEVTIVLKDGKERTLDMKDYQGNLTCANADGSKEVVRCAKVKKIEFLKPARKDKKGNAMFDHWLYSPFTGEKLEE